MLLEKNNSIIVVEFLLPLACNMHPYLKSLFEIVRVFATASSMIILFLEKESQFRYKTIHHIFLVPIIFLCNVQ